MESNPDGRPSLGDHLRELRFRLVVCAITLVVLTIVAFIFRHSLLNFLTRPYCNLPDKDRALGGRCALVTTGVTEAFTVTLKLCLYAAIVASAPVWLYQLWAFITPGLYKHERRWAGLFVATSTLLFAAGAFLAYLSLSRGLGFLLGFAIGGITSLLSVNSYLSFLTAMVLVFALSFEFPLLLVMLNAAGILSASRMRRSSRGVIFGIVVFAAGATPSQDPFTMLMLAVPIVALFGVAVAIATVHDRRKQRDSSPFDDIDDDEASSIDQLVGTQ